MANKVFRNGYNPAPFYFRDPNYNGFRLIAWTEEGDQQERLFGRFAEEIGEQIEYLYKETATIEKDGSRTWHRTRGEILRTSLVHSIEADLEFFFSDSSFQFLLRNPKTEETITYDEHAIFWIYAQDISFQRILEEEGFENREVEPIFRQSHFHKLVKDSEERRRLFRQRLVALSLFSEHEE